MLRVVVATGWIVVAPVCLNAQSVQGQGDLEARLRALEEQVKTLQAEIATLRGAVAAQPAVPTPGAAAPAGAPPRRSPVR